MILSFLPHHGDAQVTAADTLFFFKARIAVRGTDEPVQFAHIVNQTRGYASISDSAGFFRIVVSGNDLLHLTAIGYYDCPVHLNDSMLQSTGLVTLYMIPRLYAITAVEVNPLGTYRQFKYKFLEQKVPEPELVIPSSVIEDIEMGLDTIQNLAPASLGSPITAIYMALSREGRELRKYVKVMEDKEFREQVKGKYNNELLEEVTGMTGPELYDFMEFCDLEQDFIIRSSAYEILEAIYACLEEYNKKK